MRECVFIVRINQCHKLVLFQNHQRLVYVRHVVQAGLNFFRIDVLSGSGKQHVLATALDEDVSLRILDGHVAGMQPAVLVDGLCGGILILVVSQHDVHTPAHQFTRNPFRVFRNHPGLHVGHGLSA